MYIVAHSSNRQIYANTILSTSLFVKDLILYVIYIVDMCIHVVYESNAMEKLG